MRSMRIELLEERRLPSAAPTGFVPAQIRHAYGIDAARYGSLTGDGAGQTVAILVFADNPRFVGSDDPAFASSDLAQFDAALGIPDPPSFRKVAGDGSKNYPQVSGNWAKEIALDVEWLHAMAPKASIVLVEGVSEDSAIQYIESLPDVSVVSMSYGTNGFEGTASLNAMFATPPGHKGISFFQASGDQGSPGNEKYPNVVKVGGTSLSLAKDNTIASEGAWYGSGGGVSASFVRPAYQNGFDTHTNRSTPDVAAIGDPRTGLAIYDSFNMGTDYPWTLAGGTSAGTPIWAGIAAIADQFRAASGKDTLDGPTQMLPALYSLPNYDFRDIVGGNNGDYSGGVGYDLVTGRGSPVANLVIDDLAGVKGDLEYFVPTGGTHNLQVMVNGNAIEIVDNGKVATGKSISSTLNVVIHGIDGIRDTMTTTAAFDSLGISMVESAPAAKTHLIAVGADMGGYQVKVFDAADTSKPKFTLTPYSPTFLGGIRVAVGDVNGDGIPDIATISGLGSPSHIEVFDGGTGQQLMSFIAYPGYLGGATIAVGDVDGDGYADIVTGTDAGVSPHLKVFSGRDGSVLDSFYAFAPEFLGGISVAAGDVEGTGKADIIVGAASGSSPHVEIFLHGDLIPIASYMAFAEGFLGGVTVAAADMNGDGKADVIVGAAAGNSPHIKVFDSSTTNELASFLVPNATATDTVGTMRLGAVSGQILYSRSSTSNIRRFQFQPTFTEHGGFDALDNAAARGVFVGAG